MFSLFSIVMVVQVISALAIIVLVLLQQGKGADMGSVVPVKRSVQPNWSRVRVSSATATRRPAIETRAED